MTTTVDNHELLDAFDEFLGRYYDDAIRELAEGFPSEQQSLTVDWNDLFRYDPDLVDDFREDPETLLAHLEESLANYDLPVAVDLTPAHVRVRNVPAHHSYPVGAYRSAHIGEYLAISGQVQKQTEVKPKPVEAAFECQRCGSLTTIPQGGDELQEPHECSGCERQGPFAINRTASEWVDYQALRLQLPPEQAKGGNGATIDVHLEDDLVGAAEVGDRVTVPGQLTVREGSDVAFEPHLEAHHVGIDQTDYEEIDIEPYLDDIQALLEGDSDPYELLVDSIGPDIHGMETIKEALALQLFGGVRAQRPDGDTDRGEPHILLMGDPGTAKSSLLKDMERIAPRSTYASGKGATAAGMTAAAMPDDFGDGEMTLEAGALVNADKGLACVDEIDKVSEEAVESMHEALSYQTVHVNKAGFDTHLPTRTALLAAGNPEYGRFRPDRPVAEQIDLGPTLLSRFDLLYMIDDQPDPERDAEITAEMIESRRAAVHYTDDNSQAAADTISRAVETDVLRAWVAHAKQHCNPTIEDDSVATDLRESFFELRQVNGDDGPVPVTFRKLEGLMRLAEASARVRLSETIDQQDVDRARELVGRSMRDVGMDPEDGQFDADIIETGTSKSQKEKIDWTLEAIAEAAGAEPAGHEEIVEAGEAAGFDRDQVEYAIKKLKTKGKVYEASQDRYRVT